MNRRISAFLLAQPLWLTTVVSIAILLLFWQGVVLLGGYPSFILPAPLEVAEQFVSLLADGRLIRHSLITISEVIPGLMIGIFIAVPLGYLIARSALADRMLSPYLVASQAIPIIAVAPLLTIWIRSTYWARVWVAVLVVVFPIVIAAVAGIRSVPNELYELMRSLRATRSQIFRKLELPAAMPVLLAGIKVSATLAVIGALVGEFVQPKSEGLGFLLVTARYQFRTDVVFVVLITLGSIALILFATVTLLEKRLLRWRSPLPPD
jgi:NitT/TauT family transport system permease protein